MSRTRTSLIVLSVVLAASLTLFSGWVQGKLSNRWGHLVDMKPLVAKLKGVPPQFGPWKRTAERELEPDVVNELQCVGYVSRQYVNEETGDVANVALLLGPSGPISVHTPEICYSSRDFEQTAQRVAVPAGGGDDSFWAITFRTRNPLSRSEWLRVHYAWSSGGPWAAVKSPRLSFAGKPYLYKLEVAGYPPPGADPEKEDPAQRFLEDFVPVVRGCLVDSDKE